MKKEETFLIKINVARYGSNSPYTREVVFKTESGLYDNEICDLAKDTIEQFLPYKTEENQINIRAGTILLILAIILVLVLCGVYA